MIRRAVIVTLTFAAMAMLLLTVVSCITTPPMMGVTVWQGARRSVAVGLEEGRAWVMMATPWASAPADGGAYTTSARSFAGFGVKRDYFPRPGIKSSALQFPGWVAVVLLGAYPAAAFAKRWVKSRNQREGACATCGYDLTGNVSGVCPECGMEIGRP